MKFLYYYWEDNTADDMIACLTRLGHTVHKVSIPFQDYDEDPACSAALMEALTSHGCDAVFSFDFFPIVSDAAQNAGIPYLAWVYDVPHDPLLSPLADNPLNYIFIFDRNYTAVIQETNPSAHVYHLPLAVDSQKLERMLGKPHLHAGELFDVSFVGSLYENCLYNQIQYLPDRLRGYLEGIMNAQLKVYGYDLLAKSLTEQIVKELEQYIHFETYYDKSLTVWLQFYSMLNKKTSSLERIRLLSAVAQKYPFVLFTGSDSSLVPNAKYGGILDYNKEMPQVFRASKININFTLRSITSAMTLRSLDVMAAGGMLLSNYQPELAENFTEGEDLVLFDSEEDLLNKIDYYLAHDKERAEIALNGYHKVNTQYNYDSQVSKMLSCVWGQAGEME